MSWTTKKGNHRAGHPWSVGHLSAKKAGLRTGFLPRGQTGMSASHYVGQTFLSAILDVAQSRSLPFFNDIPASKRSAARHHKNRLYLREEQHSGNTYPASPLTSARRKSLLSAVT